MGYQTDLMAYPGSQYGYTGLPADKPLDLTGFRQPNGSPMEAFQRWYNAQNGGAPAQSALGSGMYAMPTNPAYAGDNIDAGGGFNPAGPGGSAPGGWLQQMRDWGVLGQTDKNGIYQQGWGGMALGAAQGLGSLYMGMQQYNLAKDSLAASKAQFERNFANQVKMTNTNLEDRQRARVASNPGAYESVDSYMNKNRVG